MKYKDYIILIPSRLKSTRLPNKPLIEINGKPMIVHVLKAAQKANMKIPILVATDSEIIASKIRNEGGEAIITDLKHESGSDRINEALNKFDPSKRYKKIIHLQGDLPNISPALIKNLADLIYHYNSMVSTVVRASEDEINNPNVVKCAISFEKDLPNVGDIGRAIYFSRSIIPWGSNIIWHHIGIYAWNRNILEKFVSLKPSILEKTEKLEQLRALEANIEIKLLVTDEKPIGIDTSDDLKKYKESLI